MERVPGGGVDCDQLPRLLAESPPRAHLASYASLWCFGVRGAFACFHPSSRQSRFLYAFSIATPPLSSWGTPLKRTPPRSLTSLRLHG
ncbi:hypothetical protein NDU88_000989 [Pleurodeles waltl]|uniref:Uncharacterized protein n=1 Tax=Pleurodeles waltl TaxID=8319 RepID=A0AAV7KRJ7_PLEWA|nr:hypothetical protein NDU88_000989 [Pleurodeles waltl]